MRVSSGLLAVVAVALVVRLGVVATTSGFFPTNDAWDFDRNAVSLVEHGVFPQSLFAPTGATAYRPPLFPIALAGAYELVDVGHEHARWDAGRILEAALGALTAGLIYLLALELFGSATAGVAGAISTVYPPLLLVGSSLLSESLFLPLVLASVLAALRARHSPRRLWWAVLAGGLVGLASLTRGNGIFLAIPVGFLVWSARPRWGLASGRIPLVMLGTCALVLAPWTIRNASVFHQFVPVTTEAGYTLAGAYNPQAAARRDFPYLWTAPVAELRAVTASEPRGNEAQISDLLQSRTISYMESHPGNVARTLFWNAVRLLNLSGPAVERWGAPYESYPRGLAVVSVYAFWLVAALAIGGALTSAARRAPLAVWGCPLVLFLSTLPLIGTTRNRAPADPFLIALGSLAIVTAWNRLQSASSARQRSRTGSSTLG